MMGSISTTAFLYPNSSIHFPSMLHAFTDMSLFVTAPNTLTDLKARFKGLVRGKKSKKPEADKTTEAAKPAEHTAASANGSAPTETTAAAEPAPATAPKTKATEPAAATTEATPAATEPVAPVAESAVLDPAKAEEPVKAAEPTPALPAVSEPEPEATPAKVEELVAPTVTA